MAEGSKSKNRNRKNNRKSSGGAEEATKAEPGNFSERLEAATEDLPDMAQQQASATETPASDISASPLFNPPMPSEAAATTTSMPAEADAASPQASAAETATAPAGDTTEAAPAPSSPVAEAVSTPAADSVEPVSTPVAESASTPVKEPESVSTPVAEPVTTPVKEPVAQPVSELPGTPVVAPGTPVAAPADAPSTPVNGGELSWAAAEKRLLELLPGVKDASVLQELADLADSDALERLVQRGKPPPKATFAPRLSVKNNIFAANETMKKAQNSQEVAKSQAKNYGLVDSKSLAVGGAGAGGGLGLNRPGAGPKVQHFAGRGSITKSISIDGDVSASWSEMMDDKSSTSWVIASYSDDGKTLNLKGKGEGGLSEFKGQLPEGIAWGGFRCNAIDKRGGLECKRPKFLFVCYKPETSSAIKKAKQASHKGDVKEAFPGAHVDVIVETMDDLDEQKLITQLQSATGAHKPNGYEFEEGKFLEADFYGLGIGKSCRGESSKN